MQQQRWKTGVLAAVVALALLGAACGGSASDVSDGSETQNTAATDVGATELRSGLTSLLQEHVYLAGIATGQALAGNDDGFAAAADTLDTNSVALSQAIGSVYGDEAETAFLELWRKHIDFFVAYTQAAASGDEDGKAQARADLDDYRTDFGAFLASANPNLTTEAVAEALIPHVESLSAAIDAQAAGDTAAFDALQEAAAHMPGTAKVLSDAIVAQFPERFTS